MVDDFSYVKSAEVLAQTGHVVYNGWATAMLGWQLLLGALFVKLFGPSFTTARASTLLISLATAYLTQRTLVRAGVNSRNATIGTLALVLSPLFLPLALSFMSDIGGLFCIVLCLYACLRALQAETDRAVLLWLAFASLSNALGGTIRQIAWLGVLVMFPCAVWLLRRRPRVVFLGVVLYLVSGAIIFAAMHWYSLQPYAVPESIPPMRLDHHKLNLLMANVLGIFLGTAVFLLPILAAFAAVLPWRDRRTRLSLAAGAAVFAALVFLLHRGHRLTASLAPYLPNYVTVNGMVDVMKLRGSRPVILTPGIRLVLTAAVFFALVSFITFLLAALKSSARPAAISNPGPGKIDWHSLLLLLVPFTICYLALLMPRASSMGLLDRYLLPLILIGILLLVRLFQDRAQDRAESYLPPIAIALTALFAAYAVAGTHDAFSFFRARAAAVGELLAAGVPDTAIDGGFEHNGLTQIEQTGHINDPRIRVPAAVYFDPHSPFPPNCEPDEFFRIPVMVPGYALSFDPNSCGRLSQFAPVTYSAWLGEHTVSIYIVKTSKAGSN
jgi:hypothetical protein